jgi:hypothetical protein
MPRNWTFFAVLALIVAISAATWAPASAEVRAGSYSYEFAAQSRPRITIHPRRVHPGPNARRQCRSWLVKEYRVSGPVIVPQMRCWWD